MGFRMQQKSMALNDLERQFNSLHIKFDDEIKR